MVARVVAIVLISLFAWQRLDAEQAVFSPTARLDRPNGWRNLSPTQAFDQAWIASANDTLWMLDPVGRLLRAHALRSDGSRGKARQAWRTPLLSAVAGRFAAEIVADDHGGAWLVDRHAGQVWHFDPTAGFSSPVHVGTAIGGVSAGAGRTLLLNTPMHSAFVFALYGVDGKVIRRFGVRRVATSAFADPVANSWRVAAVSNGGWIAAHAFAEDLVRYDQDGRLMWHVKVMSETVESLKRIDASGGAVRFADAVLPHTGGFLVKYGALSALDEFALDGRRLRTIPRIPRTSNLDVPWITGGLALINETMLVAAEPPDIVVYALGDRRTSTRTLSVQDDRAEPVPKARLAFFMPGGGRIDKRTDAAGVVRLDDIPSNVPLAVDVSADGFVSARIGGWVEELVAQPVRLKRSPRVCLTVVDRPSGALVQAFSVTLAREQVVAGGGTVEVVPSQHFEHVDGPRCVSPPVEGPWQLLIASDGHASAHARVAEGGDLRIELDPGSVLTVTVLGREREPVAGATVSVQPSTRVRGGSVLTLGDDTTRTTDDAGRAEWDTLTPGDYAVRVSHPLFLPAARTITVTTHENAAIVLDAGGRISVVVTSASATPVPDATVELIPGPHSMSTPVSCATDTSGTCRLAPAPYGSVEVGAAAASYIPGRQRVVVGSNGEANVMIVLRQGARVTGTVSHIADYAPTRFEVAAAQPGAGLLVAAISDSGEFAFEELAVGRNSLWVRELGATSAVLFDEVVVDPAGSHLSLQLPRPLRIHGRVTADGRLCGGCSITISREGAEVGSFATRPMVQFDGTYEAKVPGRGVYRVNATQAGDDGGFTDAIAVSADRRLDVSLGGASLTGRVVRRDRQEAVAFASIQLYGLGGAHVAQAVTDDAGRFRLTGLTKGRYRVVAVAGELSGEREIAIAGRKVEGIDVAVDPAQSVRVRLRDTTSGVAVTIADVTLAGRAGVTHLAAHRAGDDGFLVIPVFAGGPTDAVFKARGFAYATVRGLMPGRDPVDVLLTPGGRSFSVQIDTEGPPCAFELRSATLGSSIGLTMDRAPGPVPLSVRRALFNEVEPGSYVATMTTCEGRRYEEALVLAPGQVPVVRFSDK